MVQTNSMSTSLLVLCEKISLVQKLVAKFSKNWIYCTNTKNTHDLEVLNKEVESSRQTSEASNPTQYFMNHHQKQVSVDGKNFSVGKRKTCFCLNI